MMEAAAIASNEPAGSDLRRRREAELIGAASIEISPRDDPARDRLAELLSAGTTVFVNHAGSVTHHDIVAACVRLRREGFFAGAACRGAASGELYAGARFSAARRGRRQREADPADRRRCGSPRSGRLSRAASFWRAGSSNKAALAKSLLPAIPKAIRASTAGELDAVLRAKLAEARSRGLTASVVTQFAFEATPVMRWMAALREEGVAVPLLIGIAGPATIATLAKFAVRCGIGASLRALGRGQTAFARILAEATPDALIASLVASEDHGVAIDGLHFFAFGGVRRTAEWIHARAQGSALR